MAMPLFGVGQLSIGTEHLCTRGECLFKQGDVGTVVFILRDGLVEMIRSEHNGNEVVVNLATPPAILGFASAIQGVPYDRTALARTYCCTQRCRIEQIIQRQQEDPELGVTLCKLLGAETTQLVHRFTALACTPARCRLEQYLLELAQSHALRRDEIDVRIRFPQSECEIARHLCITPVHLSRLLAQAEREGLLRRAKGCLVLHRDRFQHEGFPR